MRKWMLLGLLSAAAAVGCGNVTDSGNDDGGDSPPGDAMLPDSPPLPDGYTRLVGRTWSVQPGQGDIYKCVRVTIPQDMYITNIMAQAPLGTHHTVLSIMSGTDGESDCNVGTLGMQMLYASGVGTSPLDFPQGVGIKVAAGTKVHLNLHLYNGSDQLLAGDSAILVKAQPTPPPMLAEMVFAGKMFFQIPAGAQNYVVQGGCTVNTPYTLFAVWPHMHQIAVRQRVDLIRNGVTTVLHDGPYAFAEQTYYLKSPLVQVQANDQISVKCTYTNNTNQTVTYGDSSDQEMCFSGLYRYPATNAGLFSCSMMF